MNIRFVIEVLVIFAMMMYAQIEILAMYKMVTGLQFEIMPLMMMGQPLTME